MLRTWKIIRISNQEVVGRIEATTLSEAWLEWAAKDKGETGPVRIMESQPRRKSYACL